jgi:hypothetical protein
MKQIVMFDTSAINALADISELASLEPGLRVGFFLDFDTLNWPTLII